MPSALRFRVDAVSGAARLGELETPHGRAATPCFMPVGTHAAVKGVQPEQLRGVGAQVMLSNTYHLALRPGEAVVRALGGLARFSGWNGPTLTDSGGYQAFSLSACRKLDDSGVRFKSPLDGRELFLSPERAVEIQEALGPDIMMALDECPPGKAPRAEVESALVRTTAWAARCREAWRSDRTALFGIVQGGLHEDLRARSAAEISALGLPGNAIGGVSVGEDPVEIARVVAFTAPLLPADRPRYLMGVGRPEDLIRAVGAGIDMFDCVMPTRHARHGQAFTATGRLNLKNARHREDAGPIEEGCDCPACAGATRAYLRHLLLAGEMLGCIWLTLHNLRFYLRLLEQARAAIGAGRYAAFAQEALGRLEAGEARGAAENA